MAKVSSPSICHISRSSADAIDTGVVVQKHSRQYGSETVKERYTEGDLGKCLNKY
jgi:hypothetical protein